MARKWIKGGGSARCGVESGCLGLLGLCLLYRGRWWMAGFGLFGKGLGTQG